MAKHSSVAFLVQHQPLSHTPSPLLQRDSPVPSLGATHRTCVSLDEEASITIRPILTSAILPSTEIAQTNMTAESSLTTPDAIGNNSISEPEVHTSPSSHAEPQITPPSKPLPLIRTFSSPPSSEPAPTPPQHSMKEGEAGSREHAAPCFPFAIQTFSLDHSPVLSPVP